MPKRTPDNIKVGSRFKNTQGEWFTILTIKNMSNIEIQFDGYNQTQWRQKWLIETGMIRNCYKPVHQSVGYVGEGKYKMTRGNPVARRWSLMLGRCYNPSFREYPRYGGRGVEVYKEWHNFQNFAEWHEKHYIDGFEMDKDLKIKGSKVYSPDTCTFIPPCVNKLLISSNACRGKYPVGVSLKQHPNGRPRYMAACTGQYLGYHDTPEKAFEVYKKFKESYIKKVAEEYKEVLDPCVYENLMGWEVVPYPE